MLAVGFGLASSQATSESAAPKSPGAEGDAAEHLWRATIEEQSYADDTASVPADDGKLRILVFGAHPDDCEHKVGGTAALWASRGHHVKFVSLTNGDAGHWHMAGGPLARRRLFEAQKAAEILGVDATEVLDIHDGELMPSLENRKTLVRLIRQWRPDVVLSHRPYDWSHPDHHHTGELVRDAQSSAGPKNFCPLTARSSRSLRAIIWYYDRYQHPCPFKPDIVVAIDDVADQKADALLSMETQLIERGTGGNARFIPKDAEEKVSRRTERGQWLKQQWAEIADRYRDKLIELYGEQKGNQVRYAEAFQLSELRRSLTPEQFHRVFPFFDR
jgi:LmbE family N-acetylglucosaminyl deacetylase